MSTLRSYFSTSTPLPVRRLLPMPSDLALPDHSHIYTCFLTFILFLSASFSLAFQIYVFFLVESIWFLFLVNLTAKTLFISAFPVIESYFGVCVCEVFQPLIRNSIWPFALTMII